MSPTAITDTQNGASKGTSVKLQGVPKQNTPGRPLDRTWRGDKAGKVVLNGIPKFDSPYDEREWIKVRDKTFLPSQGP